MHIIFKFLRIVNIPYNSLTKRTWLSHAALAPALVAVFILFVTVCSYFTGLFSLMPWLLELFGLDNLSIHSDDSACVTGTSQDTALVDTDSAFWRKLLFRFFVAGVITIAIIVALSVYRSSGSSPGSGPTYVETGIATDPTIGFTTIGVVTEPTPIINVADATVMTDPAPVISVSNTAVQAIPNLTDANVGTISVHLTEVGVSTTAAPNLTSVGTDAPASLILMDAQVGTVSPILRDGVVQTMPAQITVDHSTQVTPVEGVFVPNAMLIEYTNILEEASRVEVLSPVQVPLPFTPSTLDSALPRIIINYPDLHAIPTNSPFPESTVSPTSITIPSSMELDSYEQLLSSSPVSPNSSY